MPEKDSSTSNKDNQINSSILITNANILDMQRKKKRVEHE